MVGSLIGKPGIIFGVEVSSKPNIVLQVRQHSKFKLIKKALGRHMGGRYAVNGNTGNFFLLGRLARIQIHSIVEDVWEANILQLFHCEGRQQLRHLWKTSGQDEMVSESQAEEYISPVQVLRFERSCREAKNVNSMR